MIYIIAPRSGLETKSWVKVRDGVVSDANRVYRSFVGQPISRLETVLARCNQLMIKFEKGKR